MKRRINLLTALKVLTGSKRSVTPCRVLCKRGRGKERLLVNFNIAHSRESIKNSQK